MEDNTNTSQDALFCDSKEESSETSTNSAKFVELSERLIKNSKDHVHEKMKDPGSCEDDDSTVGDEKSNQISENSGDVSERLDEERLGDLFITKNVTDAQVPGSTDDSCEVTLIKGSQTFEEELDSLEKLAMETVGEIECKLSSGSKLGSASNTDPDLPTGISNKNVNEEIVDNTLDKRSISSDIEGLSSSESVQMSKDDLSHNEKKSFEDSDSSSSVAKSDCDVIVKEDLSNNSEKMEISMENRSENADLLKDENSLPSMKCEDSSDNHSSADDINLPSSVGTADDNILPVSGTDNSEQSYERESGNITNELGENEIPISEQIPSDSEDSKGDKITSTISSDSSMNIEIDEYVSCDTSSEANKPEEFSSSKSTKLPCSEKEICTENDDVKNYETEDDDLKVLEAFIVKSATNPEIAVCQTKQSEENTTKYSLESSLLDDLTKTDEVESVTHVTKHEGITSPKCSTKNVPKTINRSGSQSTNSKLRLSEELERASLEIASVLDSCSPPELKAKIGTRRSLKPKSLCCVGKVLPLKKRLSPRKISDFDEKVDEKSDNLQNLTGKNLSKSLMPGVVKRGRGRPRGSGKKLNLEKNFKPGKIQRPRGSESKEISRENTFEEYCGIVRNDGKPVGKLGIKDNNALSFSEKPLPSEKYTENSESSSPLRSQRRKRKILEIQKDAISALGTVVQADSVAYCNTQPVYRNQNNWTVENENKEQISIINKNVNDVENTYKKFMLPGMKYPFCSNVLTFDQLKSKAKEITLPSPLWSVQVDDNSDCIAFLGAASDISESKMVLEKAILFEKSLQPVLFLQNELINIPYCSLDNFEDVALLIENFHHLQVCDGTAVKQRPFSKYCYKFVDVANTGQRCSQCIEERRRVLFCYTKKLREKLMLLE